MRAYLLASACAVACAGASTTAMAQAPQASARGEVSVVEEVIVTATRREERLQDVPLSITTLSQEELTRKGVVGYEGLAYETPGVVLNRASANFNNFTARGISTNGYNANLQSTVAIYIDELPISANGNSTILDPTLFDVERIEFLRGPQGTLFGSGSLAGALRILTKKPNPAAFEAEALVDLGMTDGDALRQRYNAMVNIPLQEDKLALRIVGFLRDEEGYIDNVGAGIEGSNALDAWGARASLLWEPTDRLSVRLTASHEDSDPKDSSLTSPSLGIDKRISDRPDLFTGEMTNQNVTVEYQFDGARLTSSSTWSEFNQTFYVDLAGTFAQAIAFALDADAYDDTFVQETRLVSDPGGRFDWSVGGFYFERRRDVDFGYRSRADFLAARGITGLPDEYYQRLYNHTIAHEAAAFGELTYRFTDDFWVTAGLRYGSIDAQAFTEGGYNSNYLAVALAGGSGPLTVTPIVEAEGVKAEETGPSYRFSVSWRPQPNMTVYGAVATGFRAPVVNAFAGRVSLLDPTDLVIPAGAESDNLINYEVGLKGRWLDGRLSANLALYRIDWNDIQVQANRVSDSVQFATNIGGAISQGLEFEFLAAPHPNWTVALNGSVNDSEVDDLSPQEAAISGAEEGVRLSGPQFQGSLVTSYRFPVGQTAEGNASLSIQRVGSFPNTFPNTPGRPAVPMPTYDHTDAYTTVNANVAAAFEHFTVGAYVENLFDDRSVTYVHPEAFLASRYARVRPRTVGVRVRYVY
ncbi:MAG: TonB-dependent receptor [Phenylobacterium sp. RIFCSPHIGHO2_01_FULL_70_10]|nr:MAG: TonB-dependent receptor [Phenylobacterium sp. RIFCSPHIGHO2_01_FULL_70_10]